MSEDGTYCVRLIDLPGKVRGMTVVEADGFANIYLNARSSLAEQQKALRHELEHVRQDDVYSDVGIREVEGRMEG